MSNLRRIAALFVATKGVYYGLLNVDPWDVVRDARLYPGTHAVVAHPPCERWGRYWGGGPNPLARRFKKGDDGGCFAAALTSVREWGGILEHPEGSHAWPSHGIEKPPKSGGWVKAGDGIGWTCCVEQENYGHLARKATWLYAVNVLLPELVWGKAEGKIRLDEGFNSKEHRRVARANGQQPIQRLTASERVNTPLAFRDLLIRIARSKK